MHQRTCLRWLRIVAGASTVVGSIMLYLSLDVELPDTTYTQYLGTEADQPEPENKHKDLLPWAITLTALGCLVLIASYIKSIRDDALLVEGP